LQLQALVTETRMHSIHQNESLLRQEYLHFFKALLNQMRSEITLNSIMDFAYRDSVLDEALYICLNDILCVNLSPCIYVVCI
jgi:hypothetical protein